MSEYYFDYGKGGITKDGVRLEQITMIKDLNWMDSLITKLEAENKKLLEWCKNTSRKNADIAFDLSMLREAAQAVSTHRAEHYRRTNNKEGTGCYIALAKALEQGD